MLADQYKYRTENKLRVFRIDLYSIRSAANRSNRVRGVVPEIVAVDDFEVSGAPCISPADIDELFTSSGSYNARQMR